MGFGAFKLLKFLVYPYTCCRLPFDILSKSHKSQPLPPTPLYDSLTTNLPHPVMCFSSFAFPPETPLFPRAAAVETYLRDFAFHFELLSHIQLRSRVQSVGWDEVKKKWILTITLSSHKGLQTDQHECDLVLVCNGHHNLPRYPTISGLQPWLDAGLSLHSMFYRNPTTSIPFSDLSKATILVVGGGPSGLDVVSDLLDVTGKVVFSSSAKAVPSVNGLSGKGAVTKPRTHNFDLPTKTVTFTDGTTEKVDFCILATGYAVDFPFFDGSFTTSGSTEKNVPIFNLPKVLSAPVSIMSKNLINSTWGVSPLARHIFPFPDFSRSTRSFSLASFLGLSSAASAPPPISLAFLGLLVRVAPLPLLERQARAALAAFAYSSVITQEMWQEEERALLHRRDELKDQYTDEGGRPDANKIEEYITKQWQRLPEDEQFDYRDALDELAHLLSQPAAASVLPPHKTKPWEREMSAHSGLLRSAWRALEARGEAEKWVEGVGRGESTGKDGKRRTAEEEWVDLMRRVLDWWEHGTGTDGRECYVE